MQVTLRPATQADYEFGRRVHHLSYRDVIERQYGPWVEARQDEFFEANWSILDWIQIILCDGEPCGYYIEETRMSGWLDIREIVILPAYQGRGLGSQLLGETMARAERDGLPIWLQTQVQNRAAALDRRLGFRETKKNDAPFHFEWIPPGVTNPPPHICL